MLQIEVNTDWLKQYEFRSSEDEISGFIRKNPKLLFILETLPSLIQGYFSNPKFSLWMHYDPEIEQLVYLVLSIATDLEIEKAVEQLLKMENELERTTLHFVKNILMLDVE